jgi:hypothetical protein
MPATAEHLDWHVSRDPVGHLSAAVETADALLELAAREPVDQIHDAVLKAAAA